VNNQEPSVLAEDDAAATRQCVNEDVSAYTVTTDEAAAILQRSSATVRRLIKAGELAAVQVPGERTTEYRMRLQDVQDAHGRVNAYTDNRLRDHEHDARVSASAFGEEPRAPALSPTSGMQAVLQKLVAPLAAEIARLGDVTRTQAEELGMLRERVRVYESERQQPHGLAESVAEQQQTQRLDTVEERARAAAAAQLMQAATLAGVRARLAQLEADRDTRASVEAPQHTALDAYQDVQQDSAGREDTQERRKADRRTRTTEWTAEERRQFERRAQQDRELFEETVLAQYVPPAPAAVPHPDERAPHPSDAVVEEEERRPREEHRRHPSLSARILRHLR